MSTRAIIAVPTAKGYKTAWCWCDSLPDDLGKTLRTKFTTKILWMNLSVTIALRQFTQELNMTSILRGERETISTLKMINSSSYQMDVSFICSLIMVKPLQEAASMDSLEQLMKCLSRI